MYTFRSLRHRNYRLYFIGQLISLIGSWMQTTALMWLAYQLTHQARWPAFITAAMIGPTFLLGAWAGGLADRFPKHRLILRTQVAFLISSLILTTLFYFQCLNEWVLLGVMLGHGMVQAIDLPSRLAFVPELVPREDLINTVALNSAQFNTARAIGPALAGLVLFYFGPGVCFILNAFSYVAVLIALCAMRDFPKTSAVEQSGHPQAAGYAVLRAYPRLFLLILLAGMAAIGGWPLLALLPAFAERVLQQNERAYSSMLSCIGIGALLAALIAATFSNENRRKMLLIAGIGFVSTALLGLSQTDALFPAGFWCGLFGFGMILFFATGQAAVQLSVEPANRGKVMGVWAMMLSGGTPVGNLVFGPAADAWGVANIVLAQGIWMAVVLGLLILQGATTQSSPKK